MKFTKLKLRSKWKDIQNKIQRLAFWLNKPTEGFELFMQVFTVVIIGLSVISLLAILLLILLIF